MGMESLHEIIVIRTAEARWDVRTVKAREDVRKNILREKVSTNKFRLLDL